MSSNLEKEIARRRTFGIISHPDAGKTTLTEKLLYFGGAIQAAGEVKARKSKRQVTSDFMEIERQRGISVASSVMGFEYREHQVNIVDTPGHQDFSEDTYRTLTAVDSAIMVIDHSKGVEAQTEKLLDVCRMRSTPVMTFINKLDREGKDPFELLDEIEKMLKIQVVPLIWPIGMGRRFKGIYSLLDKRLMLFSNEGKQERGKIHSIEDVHSSECLELIGEEAQTQIIEDLEMVEGVYPAFNTEDYLSGKCTPILFGSAINNFGVQELLDTFLKLAPPPLGRKTDQQVMEPKQKDFSGFIFKIHANMDPKHRDRLAFLRICSGTFERGRSYLHQRSGKKIKFPNPTAFMAQEKTVIDEAFPGDIIGLYDTGNFKIGDTLSEKDVGRYQGIPAFSPEIFRYAVNTDPGKAKQFQKGLSHLTDEGVAQLFTLKETQRLVVGTVGQLQFEVIEYRLKNEYGASCRFENFQIHKAIWLEAEKNLLEAFIKKNSSRIAYDKKNNPVYLAESRYLLNHAEQENPEIKFLSSSEF